MKPTRSPRSARPNGVQRQTAAAGFRACFFRGAFVILPFVGLPACEQNSFVPPPPPKVDAGLPAKLSITRFLEATGNTAPIKRGDLVTRAQGLLPALNYQAGT